MRALLNVHIATLLHSQHTSVVAVMIIINIADIILSSVSRPFCSAVGISTIDVSYVCLRF